MSHARRCGSIGVVFSAVAALGACNDGAADSGVMVVEAPPISGSVEAVEKAAETVQQPGEGALVWQLPDTAALASAPRVAVSDWTPQWRDALREVSVPALVVATNGRAADVLSVATGEGWYTTQLWDDGVYVTLFGTQVAFDWDMDVAPDQRITEDTPLITRSEGIPSIAFTRFGVSYRLDVECDAGPTDARCADFETLHHYYRSLALATPDDGAALGVDDLLGGQR